MQPLSHADWASFYFLFFNIFLFFNCTRVSWPLVLSFVHQFILLFFNCDSPPASSLRILETLMWLLGFYSILLGFIIEFGLAYLRIAQIIPGCRDSLFLEYMLVLHDAAPQVLGDDLKTGWGGLLVLGKLGSVVVIVIMIKEYRKVGELPVKARMSRTRERQTSSWDYIKLVSWIPSLSSVWGNFLS